MNTPTSSPRLSAAYRGLAALLASAALGTLSAQPYTAGFKNLARTETPGTLISHPSANGSELIGRTTTVAYFNGWVIVGGENPGKRAGSDLSVRVYDMANPAAPVRKHPSDFGLTYTNNRWHVGDFGWNAHAVAQVENYLIPNTLRVTSFGGAVEKAGGTVPDYDDLYPFGGWNRAAMAGPWLADMLWYPSATTLAPYQDPVNPKKFEITKRIRNSTNTGWTTKLLAQFDHFPQYGGPDWHPIFFGDLLIYARSGGSASDGVVVYRLQYNNFTDPATMSITPQLVASYSGGLLAYWPNLFSDGSGLYLVGAGTDVVTALDLTSAANPASVNPVITKAGELSTPLSNAPYPVYQDRFAFIHNKKIDMTKLIADDPNPIVLTLNETANNLDTSQISLPLGNLWLTGGYDKPPRVQGMGVWVQQQAPDTTRPEVANFHIPQVDRANYPRFAPLSFLLHETPRRGGLRNGIDFTVRPVGSDGTLGAHVPGFLIHDMSGVLTFNQSSPLASNTTYQVNFLASDNGTPSNLNDDIGFQDAAGNLIVPYSFRFSTGSDVAGAPPPTITSTTASVYQPAPGTSTRVTVSATGTGLQYRFNFNGTWTTWSTTAFADFTYTTAGRNRVLVQVKNADGTVSTSSVNILVITPPVGPFPTQSNTLAVGVDSGVRRVWTVNPDANTVTAINASTGAKLGEYAAGKHPRSITRDQNGRYWVAAHGSDSILILNSNGSVFQTINTGYGTAPFAVVANPAGTSVFASYYGSGRVARFTVPTGTTLVGAPVVSTTSVPTARAIAVSGDGTRVFVTRFISPEMEAEVFEFNGTSTALTLTRTIKLAYSYTEDNGDRGGGVPNYLSSIAISPDGKYALVTSKQDNVARGELYAVGDLTHENTVRSIVSVINLQTNQNKEVYAARRDIDNSDSPSFVTFTPLGDTAIVALQGNNRIVGFDALNLGATTNVTATLSFSAGVGLAPQGVLVDNTSQRIHVQNFMGRSVTVINGTPLLGQNLASFPKVATPDTVTKELLPTQVLLGKEIFYNAADPAMGAEGYISCASCHIDGGHDGRVWDFTGRGEGLRRTIDLRGRRGLGHGNVHWSANFDEIHDFEHDITGPFDGLGFLPAGATLHPPLGSRNSAAGSPELDALAAYVGSLDRPTVPKSAHRNTDGTLTNLAAPGASAVRGKVLFESTGTSGLNCVSCHAGTRFTNSNVTTSLSNPAVKDVGTTSVLSGGRLGGLLPGIDTPTLLGIHATASYLHHGSARTLDEVFSYTGGTLLEAEDGTPSFLYASPVVPNDSPSEGGGGTTRGLVGGGRMLFRVDTEDANNNGTLNSGEDTNGNGVIDSTTTPVRLTFTNVDGGTGGASRLAIRYLTGTTGNFEVLVNGTLYTLPVQKQFPDLVWHVASWRWGYYDINLQAGANTLVFRRGNVDLSLDCVIVSPPAELAAAVHHRKVLSRTDQERADLAAYLRQIDGRDPLGKIVDPHLVLHYTFNEGSGTTLNDVSGVGNNHTTTVASTNWITGGKFGGAYGSATDFKSFFPANQSDLNFDPRADDYSISLWVKISGTGGYGTIFSKGGSTTATRQYHLWTGASPSSLTPISGGTASALTVTPALNDGNWHLLTFVNYNDAGTWKTRLYFDNGATYKEFSTGTSGKVADLLRIGEASTGFNRMTGFIDDLRIYTRPLSANDVAALYDGRDPNIP